MFVDESVGVTDRGPGEVGKTVEEHGTAFSDIHCEPYDVYVAGDVVVVELALQGLTTGGSGCVRGSFRQRATAWTGPAATSFVSRTGGFSCLTVTRRDGDPEPARAAGEPRRCAAATSPCVAAE